MPVKVLNKMIIKIIKIVKIYMNNLIKNNNFKRIKIKQNFQKRKSAKFNIQVIIYNLTIIFYIKIKKVLYN